MGRTVGRNKCCLLASLLILSFATISFAQVPQVQHVLIVLEENTDYADVCGPNNTSMPFLCSLKSQGSFSGNYYAPTHPSIGNYDDLGWGVVTTNDDSCNPNTCGFPYNANNIVRASQAAGKTWKGYAESLPSSCYFGGDSGAYAVRHSPIPYISDVQTNCQNRYVAFEDPNLGFAHDLANNTLPNFAFITPNLCDDGHDCTLPGSAVPDQWLQNNVLQPLLNSGHLNPTTGDTVVIVTFDESNADNTNGGGGVYWFMMGKGVKQNYQSSGPSAAPGFYSHESSLRVIAEMLGASLSGLGGAGSAPDMAEFFGSSSNSGPPVAVLTVTPQTGSAPLQVTADSSGSSDPNGGIISRLIDFGDGTTSTAVTATHTYNTAGTFPVNLSVTDNLQLTSSASSTVTVSAPPPISVTVSPASATVFSGSTQPFTATVANTTNQAITWTATAGTISAAGLFTAPVVSTNTTVTVTASSVADPSKTASATVTVQPAPPPISVTVSPTSATVSSGGTQGFTATVANTTNQAVTWTATAGTISAAGLFTAPVVLTNTTVTVTASSVAAPSKTASATVTVQPSAPPPVSSQTVQHTSGFTGGASSVAVGFKSNVTAGDVLLVAQSTFDGETLNAPADSQGNAFALLATGDSPGASVAAIYVATAKSTGADTVTCSIGASASDNIHCHIYEISGTTAVVDAVGSAVQTARSLSVSTSKVTSNASDYVFAYFGDNVAQSTYVAGSGFGDTEQSESPSQDSGFSEDKLAATTGIQTATATASTADPFVGLIVALKNFVVTPAPPSCTLSVSPTSGVVPLQVSANATCTDPQNALVSTVITWGDGTSTNGSSGAHTYLNAGTFTVTATATDGANLTGSASQTVTVTSVPAPSLTSVTPNAAAQGQSLTGAIITGSNFQNGATCNLGAGITVNSCAFTSTTQLTANLSISATATVGVRNVTVTNPDAQNATLTSGFSVTAAVLPPPSLSSVTPNTGAQGQNLTSVSITGSNFQNLATCSFGAGITVNSCAFTSATQLTANLSISATATVGVRNVTVINPDAQGATLTNGFSVTAAVLPPPTLTSLTPNTGVQGQNLNGVIINGSNFQNGATCNLGVGITVNSCTFASATQLAANLAISATATVGVRNVTVTNPDAQSVTLTSGFSVTAAVLPPPSLTSVAPSTGGQGQNLTSVILTGSNFQNGATCNFGAGITVNSCAFTSATQLTANLSTSATAAAGPRNVTVTNPDAQSATLANGFSVSAVVTNPPPSLSGVSPSTGTQGQSLASVIVTGSSFVSGATCNFGAGITVNSCAFTSATQLTASLSVAATATVGVRNVTVTNPDTQSATLTNGFTVTQATAGNLHIDFNYASRTALLADSWDFLAKTASGVPRDTEQSGALAVDYDQTVHPGTLRVPIPKGDIYKDSNDSQNTLLRDLPTDWTSMRLEIAVFPAAANYQQVDLVAYQDDDNYVVVSRMMDIRPTVEFYREQAQVVTGVGFTALANTGSLVLRIDRDAASNAYTGYYSTDGGTTWVGMGTTTQALSNPRLAIHIGANYADTLPTADIAWVEILRPGT
jgi:PKD repeat protein